MTPTHTALTRSRITTDHALITPESHVLLSPPGWTKANVVYFISPQMGANFTMFMGVFEAGGAVTRNLGDNEILGYVLEGESELSGEEKSETWKKNIETGAFFYMPPGTGFALTAKKQSRVLFFEKMYEPLAGVNPPAKIISHESQITKEAFLGDPGALLQTLMPMGAEFDMGVNIFEFAPGGTLPNVENHYMEHGLYVLQGQGVYRLSESWYPVQKDDAIWMAPYCLQWFVASGKTSTKYIYYKDMNRPPLV